MGNIANNNLVPLYTKHIYKTYGYKKALLFWIKYLGHPKAVNNWLQYSHNYHKSLGKEFSTWKFFYKPMRAYIVRGYKLQQRINLIKSHYEIMSETFPQNYTVKLSGEQETLLNTLTGKSGIEYSITMGSLIRFRREGELSVIMRDKTDNIVLAIITFVLAKKPDGSRFMLIGGVQGPSVKTGKERVVKATRDLNGLRPKNAVLNAIYPLAKFFDVKEIEAISMANHPVKNTNQRKQKTFFADYDSFWSEVTEVKNAKGNFILPEVLPRKKLEEVPSKKKKDWLKRQQYISEMAASCAAVMTSLLTDLQMII